MKTKELIRRLQEEDPSGEIECCVGNCDIFFLERIPAYYDGRLQLLVRDPAKAPYYDVVGARYVSSGEKIKIRYLSISDALGNDPDMPIDYSGLGPEEYAKRYRESDDKTRQAYRDMDRRMWWETFWRWAKAKGETISADFEGLPDIAETFFDQHLYPLPELPKDIREATKTDRHGIWHLSQADKWQMFWERFVDVKYEGLDWKFELRVR